MPISASVQSKYQQLLSLHVRCLPTWAHNKQHSCPVLENTNIVTAYELMLSPSVLQSAEQVYRKQWWSFLLFVIQTTLINCKYINEECHRCYTVPCLQCGCATSSDYYWNISQAHVNKQRQECSMTGYIYYSSWDNVWSVQKAMVTVA